MARTSDAKIEEALDLLNEAAKEKKEDIGSIISERYEDLRRYLAKGRSETMGRKVGDRISDSAMAARDAVEKQARRAAESVDRAAHQQPWPYIGGAAIITMFLGFLLGRRS